MEPITLTQPPGQPPQAGSSPQYTATDGTQLNPTAVALAKAIRTVESNGNYKAVGDAGQSHGAYQFNKNNFGSWAKQYGLDPADMSAMNQDKVAYHRINDMLKQGNAPSEVAARWNGATYSNGKYSAIAPAYVEKVKNAYQQHSQLAPGVPSLQISKSDPNQPQAQSQDQGLGQQLSGRGNDISTAINDTMSGKINPISGLIQGAGAIAGGAGDIVNKGLELIPGFKGIEGLIGQGVGWLAQTPVGQTVGKAVKDFSTAHPELSKDIGAGFNIATALPIFEGLGALKNVAMDGASVALKNIAEKGAIKDLTEVASRTVGGRGVVAAVPDAVETMVKERALPEIVGKRYVTDSATAKISSAISAIDKNELQPILEKVSGNQNFGQNLGTLKKLSIQEAENDAALKEAGMVPKALKQIDARFEGWAHSYGDTVDLATENRLKIGSGKFSDWGTPEGSADKAIYHAFQHNIEDVAQKNGLGDVAEINSRMAKLIKTQDLFKYINGKAVKNTGLVHQIISGAATAGGEVAGNAVGVPFAGAIVGNKTSGLVERALSGLSPRALRANILERTTQGAARQGLPGLVKRTAKMAAGSIANQLNR
jgi:hypothetical protein